jgi:AcrR family transcriptional regulator
MKTEPGTKRQRIIAAAARLWRETHNVKKVSLEDIAREAGVSPTTIYNNFRDREGLVAEVIRHLTRETLDKQWAIVDSDLPIPEKMRSITAVKFSTLGSVKNDALTKLSEDPSYKQYLDKLYESEVKLMMTQLIEEGKRQGYIAPDLPEESIMLFLDIFKEGGIACAEKLQKILNNKRVMTGLIRIFYHGLFQKEFEANFDSGPEKEN